MKMSLYELTNDLAELLEMSVDEVSIEEKEAIEEQIMELIKNKSENTIKFLRNLESMIKATKEEEERLKEYRKSQEKKYDNLKSYMIDCLIKADMKSFDTKLGRVSLRKSPASVEVDLDLLPEDFKIEKVTYSADKKTIKKLLQSGEKVQGAKLIENKYGLTIK